MYSQQTFLATFAVGIYWHNSVIYFLRKLSLKLEILEFEISHLCKCKKNEHLHNRICNSCEKARGKRQVFIKWLQLDVNAECEWISIVSIATSSNISRGSRLNSQRVRSGNGKGRRAATRESMGYRGPEIIPMVMATNADVVGLTPTSRTEC